MSSKTADSNSSFDSDFRSGWKSRVQFLGLIAWLVIQCGLAWFLLVETPITQDFRGSYSFSLSADRQTVLWGEHYSAPNGVDFRQCLGLDLKSGCITKLDQFQERIKYSTRPGEVLLMFDSNYSIQPGKQHIRRLVKLDTQSGDVIGDVQIETKGITRILQNRFLLDMTQDSIRILDTQNPRLEWSELSAPQTGKFGFVYCSEDGLWFYRTSQGTPQQSTGVNTAGNIELFALNQQGKPQLLAQWPIYLWANDPYQSTCIRGSMIAQIGSDLRSIEFRSASDGSLAKSFQIPDVTNLAMLSWSLSSDQRLSVGFPEGWKVLDLDTGQWQRTPNNARPIEYDRKSGLMLCVQKEGDGESFLIAKDDLSFVSKPCNKLAWPLTMGWPMILDDSTLLALSYCYGMSVVRVDVTSGEITRWYRPYWYVPIVLAAIILSHLLWSWAWCCWSLSVGGWAWADSLIVGLIPLVLLTCRFTLVGVVDWIDRAPSEYAQSIFFAFSCHCIGWAVLGKTRWNLRLLPCCVWFAAFLATVSWVFKGYPNLAWLAIKSIWIVVPLTMWFLVLRLAGLRYQNSKEVTKTKLEWVTQWLFRNRFEGRPQIIDLVLLTSAMSLLASAFRLTPPIDSRLISLSAGEVLLLSAVVLLPLAIYCSAMTCRRPVYVAGVVIASILTMLIAIDPIVEFIYFTGWDYEFRWLPMARIATACCVATFIFALPFRLRGWRIARSA